MATLFNEKQAYEIAIRYTNLTNNDPKLLSIECEDGLYHIIVRAAFLDYEFYVDATCGEILGLSTEPADENECQEMKCAC